MLGSVVCWDTLRPQAPCRWEHLPTQVLLSAQVSSFAGAGAHRCFCQARHSHTAVTAAPELLLGDRAECTLQVDM